MKDRLNKPSSSIECDDYKRCIRVSDGVWPSNLLGFLGLTESRRRLMVSQMASIATVQLVLDVFKNFVSSCPSSIRTSSISLEMPRKASKTSLFAPSASKLLKAQKERI
ncbi:hypothetical protein Tco_1301081 [Tanacetum coccineum]